MTAALTASTPHPFIQGPKHPTFLRGLPDLPLGNIFTRCTENEFFAVALSERCMVKRSVNANFAQKKIQLAAFKVWLLDTLKTIHLGEKPKENSAKEPRNDTPADINTPNYEELASAIQSLAFEGSPTSFKDYHQALQNLFRTLHCATAEKIDFTSMNQLTPEHLGHEFFIGPRLLQGFTLRDVPSWNKSRVGICSNMVKSGNTGELLSFARYFRPASTKLLLKATEIIDTNDECIAILEMTKYSDKSTRRMAGMLDGSLHTSSSQGLLVDLFRHSLESRNELLSFVKMMVRKSKDKSEKWLITKENREGHFLIYALKRYGHLLVTSPENFDRIKLKDLDNYGEPLQSLLYYHLFQCPIFLKDHKSFASGICQLAQVSPQINLKPFVEIYLDQHQEEEKIIYFIKYMYPEFPHITPFLLKTLKRKTSEPFQSQIIMTLLNLSVQEEEWHLATQLLPFAKPSNRVSDITLDICRSSMEIEDFNLFFSALEFVAEQQVKRALIQSALDQHPPDAISYHREQLQDYLADLDRDDIGL